MFYEIKVKTITSAQRGVNILREYGVKAQIGRIKTLGKSEGCGYTLRVKTDCIDRIIKLLNSRGISTFGVERS